MGVDYHVCKACKRTFPDCIDFAICDGCCSYYCSADCAELEDGEDHGDEQTCIDCRLELASDENLLALALETLGMTREALVAEFEAQARRINGRE